MILSNKIKEIKCYLDKVEEELRKELDLTVTANSTIGISFAPEIQLSKMPEDVSILSMSPILGCFYVAELKDGVVSCEVIAIDLLQKHVIIRAFGNNVFKEQYEKIGINLFNLLFKLLPARDLVSSKF